MFTGDKSMFDAFKKIDTAEEEQKPARPERKESEPEETAGPPVAVPPVLRCSDCRITMYKNYFAMAGRPVCTKCRAPYAKQLAYGRGPEATTRALLWGGSAALGCALLFGGMSMTLPFLRHLMSFGIAYAIAKLVMSATGNLGGRSFQWMAVVFVYGAIGLGSVMPVALAVNDKSVIAAVEVQRKHAKEFAAPPIGSSKELVGDADQGADAVLDARRDITTIAEQLEKSVLARQELAKIHVGMTPDQKQAAQFILQGAVPMGLLLTFFFSPFVGLLSYGVFSAGVGLLLLIFSIFKSWRWTEQQQYLELSGPHRVGEGPIPPMY
ncbi:MAG: hypothetical protein ACT4P6_12520 [Gemmatimonadaceae bacterium]